MPNNIQRKSYTNTTILINSQETKTYCRSHHHCQNYSLFSRHCAQRQNAQDFERTSHFRVPLPNARYDARECCVSAVWKYLPMILLAPFLLFGHTLSSNKYKLILLLWSFCYAWDISYHVVISRNNNHIFLEYIFFFKNFLQTLSCLQRTGISISINDGLAKRSALSLWHLYFLQSCLETWL